MKKNIVFVTLVLVLFTFHLDQSPMMIHRVSGKIDQNQSEDIDFFAFSIFDKSKAQTSFRLKNGSNIAYKTILLMNFEDSEIKYNIWTTGIVPPGEYRRLVYDGDSNTVSFEFIFENKTFLFGFIRFTTKSYDEEIQRDFNTKVEVDLLQYLGGIIIFNIIAVIVAPYFGRFLRKYVKEEVKYL